MKNKDKYKGFFDEFEGGICNSGAPWDEVVCMGKPCEGCIHRFLEWLEDEEHTIISKVERDLLANIDGVYSFIGRDSAGDLWLFENAPRLNDGVFENNVGRIYKCPDFIAGEFNGIERESLYMIAEL